MIWKLVIGVVAALVALVGVLALLGEETFHIEVTVPAPPEAVWAVLIDTDAYSDWNPVFIRVEGDYVEGTSVKNTVRAPGDETLEIEAVVQTVEPARELRQSGGIPGLLTFNHQWLLVPEDGGTRVIQHEVDRGLFMWFWDSSWIIPSYTETSEALRDRVMAGRDT